MTTITAEGSDPPSAAASEVLTSLHLAQTEAGQAFSQAKSDVPSQGDGAGTPRQLPRHLTSDPFTGIALRPIPYSLWVTPRLVCET